MLIRPIWLVLFFTVAILMSSKRKASGSGKSGPRVKIARAEDDVSTTHVRNTTLHINPSGRPHQRVHHTTQINFPAYIPELNIVDDEYDQEDMDVDPIEAMADLDNIPNISGGFEGEHPDDAAETPKEKRDPVSVFFLTASDSDF